MCICGYNKDCPEAFDLHHIDPNQKDFTISQKIKSWAKISKELKKCVLLCCRCHRELHYKMVFLPVELPKFDDKEFIKIRKSICTCGNKKRCSSVQCSDCHKNLSLRIKNRPKIIWPPTEELMEMTKNLGYAQVGRNLGVPDNAVRKWIKSHPVVAQSG